MFSKKSGSVNYQYLLIIWIQKSQGCWNFTDNRLHKSNMVLSSSMKICGNCIIFLEIWQILIFKHVYQIYAWKSLYANVMHQYLINVGRSLRPTFHTSWLSKIIVQHLKLCRYSILKSYQHSKGVNCSLHISELCLCFMFKLINSKWLW